MNTFVLMRFNGSPTFPLTPTLTLLDWDWEDFYLSQKLDEQVEERAIATKKHKTHSCLFPALSHREMGSKHVEEEDVRNACFLDLFIK